MSISEEETYEDEPSGTEDELSGDSQDDPTFDAALDDTRLHFSTLSLKGTKIKRHLVNRSDEKEEKEEEIVIPKLDEKDQKTYEAIEKFIEDGRVEKLKVDQCKIYLRKHGLRLSGNKETLIQRIKEHISIVSGGGEAKYPASSFVLNCKGDACTGDIVIFEQNVYEMFNIASRSATGPPCGTRIVAGRIVKESYGAAKQQHTFTIEVLWSKGVKPLPPLHPLLIKGRNLYRLKTMRQKWEDESQRHQILSEKHARGGVARITREARVQQKELRKVHQQTRALRNEPPNRKQEEETKRKPLHDVSMKPENLINQHKKQDSEQQNMHRDSCQNLRRQPNNISGALVPPEALHERQPLTGTNFLNYNNTTRSSIQGHSQTYVQYPNHQGFSSMGQSDMNLRYPPQNHGYCRERNVNATRNSSTQVQTCRYYAQGRCHFGDRCRYLHDK